VSDPPLFTVLLPVHRSPELMASAIDSVLSQTEERLELLVICDGAPAETAELARDRAARDRRVRVLPFPKGERHGEAHRDTALRRANGTFVAQIGDDDLWFPDYLRELAVLLDEVDFGNLVQVDLETDGTVRVHAGDLADPAARQQMLETDWNFFGPTFCGYRLDAYRALPVGWSPAPPGVWTDLHMWRKFLAAPGLTFGTRFAVEGVKLPAEARDVSATARVEEHRAVVARYSTEPGRRELRARAWQTLHRLLDDHARNLQQQRDTVQRDATDLVDRLAACESAAASDALQVATLRHRVRRLRRRNGLLADRLARIEQSRSWRLSAPLRRMSGWLHRRILRGPAA
jgi:hypothetical protein